MSIDFDELYRALDETVSFFDREEEKVVAQTLKTRIVNRTLNGSDVHGAALLAYTPRYKLFRQRHGLQVSKVDLYALGNPHLLNTITQMDDHTLFFLPESVEIARGLQSKREFFAANESDWQAVADAVAIDWNKKELV